MENLDCSYYLALLVHLTYTQLTVLHPKFVQLRVTQKIVAYISQVHWTTAFLE